VNAEDLTLNNSSDAQVVEYYQKLGRQMGEQQARATYEDINRVTEEIGNVVDAQSSLTPGVFFAVIEKIRIEFDRNGKPRLPTIVVHPQRAQAWKRLGESMEADPANRRRMNELLTQKELEWREREASRKLVG